MKIKTELKAGATNGEIHISTWSLAISINFSRKGKDSYESQNERQGWYKWRLPFQWLWFKSQSDNGSWTEGQDRHQGGAWRSADYPRLKGDRPEGVANTPTWG